jgi:hypothetical protein
MASGGRLSTTFVYERVLLVSGAIPFYPTVLPRHSHSIVLRHDNTLIGQQKSFWRTVKHRLPDPSEIRALDFMRKFRRSEICLVSATIGINRSNLGVAAALSQISRMK